MVKQGRIWRGDWPSCHVDCYRSYFRWLGSRVLSLGSPKKLSWQKDSPAGYVNFAAKLTDGKLEFKSGDVAIGAKVSGSSMTLRSVNPSPQQGQSRAATIKLSPLWRLFSQGGPERLERQRMISEPTVKPKPPRLKVALEGDSRPGKVVGLSMEERYRACRRLVKGFTRRDACARNGGI
jgi:hypothetical protein